MERYLVSTFASSKGTNMGIQSIRPHSATSFYGCVNFGKTGTMKWIYSNGSIAKTTLRKLTTALLHPTCMPGVWQLQLLHTNSSIELLTTAATNQSVGWEWYNCVLDILCLHSLKVQQGWFTTDSSLLASKNLCPNSSFTSSVQIVTAYYSHSQVIHVIIKVWSWQ